MVIGLCYWLRICWNVRVFSHGLFSFFQHKFFFDRFFFRVSLEQSSIKLSLVGLWIGLFIISFQFFSKSFASYVVFVSFNGLDRFFERNSWINSFVKQRQSTFFSKIFVIHFFDFHVASYLGIERLYLIQRMNKITTITVIRVNLSNRFIWLFCYLINFDLRQSLFQRRKLLESMTWQINHAIISSWSKVIVITCDAFSRICCANFVFLVSFTDTKCACVVRFWSSRVSKLVIISRSRSLKQWLFNLNGLLIVQSIIKRFESRQNNSSHQ